MDTLSWSIADEFLLTLIHDVRAYVRRSLSGIQLIERAVGNTQEVTLRQRFEQVVGANKELDKFLARLADYAGAAHPMAGPALPLLAIVKAALLRFPRHPIELIDPVPETAREILLPPEMVRVFVELIDNALKFSRNGRVTIHIEPAKHNGATRVMICDFGIGVPSDEKERVFDLLISLQSRETYPGFGLGLPICRRIADLAGAGVSLASNPVGGTIAIVDIPNAQLGPNT